MQYVGELVAELERSLPWGDIDAAERHTFACFYALLSLTSPDRIGAKSVHDAWACSMAALGFSHPSIVPFEDLEPTVRAKDEPFVAALMSSVASFRSTQEE
jgi:hypothetical protein